MTKLTALSTFRTGESGIVKALEQNELTPRLLEMGIYEGKYMKVLFRAPLGCPLAVDVDGYLLSLRLDEANMILVETDPA